MKLTLKQRLARETAILRLAAEGRSTGDIASILGTCERTVKSDLSAFCWRHGLANRAHAVAFAIRKGLI
jgi:DNA-binding NarL/FixJ family response regulator